MHKSEFLHDPDVREMLRWLREQLEANDAFVHAYTDRQSGRRWSCNGLFDAFRTYEWNGKDWATNKRELDEFRVCLRAALAAGDENGAIACSEAVLRWGGVIAKNGITLASRRGAWVEELRHMSSVLTAGQEPLPTDILRVQGVESSGCKMNAGFVKIYSVLLDHFVIYDGRVGAALGLLVRQFCEQTNKLSVPEALKFAYGLPKEDRNARAPKTRNPSLGPYRFPLLRPNARFHCVQAMRASWLLKAALEPSPGPFSEGEEGFHEFAAGLFMIGYDLPRFVAGGKG